MFEDRIESGRTYAYIIPGYDREHAKKVVVLEKGLTRQLDEDEEFIPGGSHVQDGVRIEFLNGSTAVVSSSTIHPWID